MGAPQYEQAGADVSGSGTPGTIPVWSTGTTLGNSIVTQTAQGVVVTGFTNGLLPTSGSTPTNASFLVRGPLTNALFMGASSASPFGTWLQSTDAAVLGNWYPLLLNPNGGNVGIGTASPSAKLEVPFTGSLAGMRIQIGSANYFNATNHFFRTLGDNNLVQISGNYIDASFQASYGLKLPATPGNTDPNTLDAYADGGTANSGGVTWTPTLRFGGVDITTLGGTYGTRVGRYTRIGNTIVAHCYIALTAKGTATGAATIDGLPTSSNTSGLFAAGSIGYTVSITFTNQLLARVNANSTSIALTNAAAAGTLANVTDANFSNTSEIVITVSYPVT